MSKGNFTGKHMRNINDSTLLNRIPDKVSLLGTSMISHKSTS